MTACTTMGCQSPGTVRGRYDDGEISAHVVYCTGCATDMADEFTPDGDDSLASAGHPVPRKMLGTTCAVHRHRDYVPMERHHIWPLGMGGPDKAPNIVIVCCNGHYSIHDYIRQLMRYGHSVPWDQAQHYGEKVRALATRGWTEAGSPTRGGAGE